MNLYPTWTALNVRIEAEGVGGMNVTLNAPDDTWFTSVGFWQESQITAVQHFAKEGYAHVTVKDLSWRVSMVGFPDPGALAGDRF